VRWNSSGTGTPAIPGFQTARENLEVPGDPLAQPGPGSLAAQEALEALESPEVLWVLAALVGLGVPAGLGVPVWNAWTSPTGVAHIGDLRTLHEL